MHEWTVHLHKSSKSAVGDIGLSMYKCFLHYVRAGLNQPWLIVD